MFVFSHCSKPCQSCGLDFRTSSSCWTSSITSCSTYSPTSPLRLRFFLKIIWTACWRHQRWRQTSREWLSPQVWLTSPTHTVCQTLKWIPCFSSQIKVDLAYLRAGLKCIRFLLHSVVQLSVLFQLRWRLRNGSCLKQQPLLMTCPYSTMESVATLWWTETGLCFQVLLSWYTCLCVFLLCHIIALTLSHCLIDIHPSVLLLVLAQVGINLNNGAQMSLLPPMLSSASYGIVGGSHVKNDLWSF